MTVREILRLFEFDWWATDRTLESVCTESRLSAPLAYRDKKGNHHAEPLYQQMRHAINLNAFYRLGPEQQGLA